MGADLAMESMRMDAIRKASEDLVKGWTVVDVDKLVCKTRYEHITNEDYSRYERHRLERGTGWDKVQMYVYYYYCPFWKQLSNLMIAEMYPSQHLIPDIVEAFNTKGQNNGSIFIGSQFYRRA